MWTCSLLKQNAKQALRGRYWRGFLVCFVLGLLGVTSGTGSVSYSLDLGALLATSGETEEAVWPGAHTMGLLAPTAYYRGGEAAFWALGVGFVLFFLVLVLTLALCWGGVPFRPAGGRQGPLLYGEPPGAGAVQHRLLGV